jgi:CheY-like chemotaxis protein
LRAAEHGGQMTQQLLAFARRGVLQSRIVNLNDVVSAMTDFLRRTLGDLVTLEVAPAKDLWPCRLDPVQFEAAVLNLAINARDAMPEGGRLRIELTNADIRRDGAGLVPHVCVRLTDTGTGMNAEVVERAFEPFFTTKSIGEGSGLGLSQVYGFVNQSGGTVTIDSALGVGTTLSLYLPRSDEPLVEQRPAAVSDTSASGSGATVLIVEDEDFVRDVAVAMIEDMGYRVLTARDGIEALALLRGQEAIDVLFSDVLMPGGITGVALAARARQLRKDLGILLTSGYPANDRSAIGENEFPILQKPYKREALSKMLRAALDT